MATVKKGNGTTKRRRAKAASARGKPGAEKPAGAAQQPNSEYAQDKATIDAAAQVPRETPAPAAPAVEAPPVKPVVEAAAKPVLSKPIIEPAVEPVAKKPAAEPILAAVRTELAPARSAAEITRSKPAPAKPDVEAIRLRAYHIFLARGGTHGSALEDWLAAERQLIEETRAN